MSNLSTLLWNSLEFIIYCTTIASCADKLVPHHTRDRLSKWLNQYSSRNDWPKLFIGHVFDPLFDPLGRGRPSFRRSALATLFVLTCVSVGWYLIRNERVSEALEIIEGEWWAQIIHGTC